MAKLVCAVFLVRSNGEVLFQLRDNKPTIRHPNKWSVLGGHPEPGEELIDCAYREMEEETTYKAKELKYLTTQPVDNAEDSYHCAFYWEVYDEQQELVCLEGQRIQFIPRHEAQKYPILEFLLPLWDDILTQLKVEDTHGKNPLR